jgi:hypothetical protein
MRVDRDPQPVGVPRLGTSSGCRNSQSCCGYGESPSPPALSRNCTSKISIRIGSKTWFDSWQRAGPVLRAGLDRLDFADRVDGQGAVPDGELHHAGHERRDGQPLALGKPRAEPTRNAPRQLPE